MQRIISLKSLQKNTKGASEEGLQDGFTRVTFIIKSEYLNAFKKIARIHNFTMKRLIGDIISSYLVDKNVRAIPKKRKKKL